MLPYFYFQFAEQNNQSLSILTFVPVIEDDGKYLTCRAENPSIPDSALEDKWRLNVYCKYKSKIFLLVHFLIHFTVV